MIHFTQLTIHYSTVLQPRGNHQVVLIIELIASIDSQSRCVCNSALL